MTQKKRFSQIRQYLNYVSIKLFLGIVAVVIPLFTLLWYENYSAQKAMLSEMSRVTQENLDFYQRQLTERLLLTQEYIATLATANYDFQMLKYTFNPDERTLLRAKFARQIRQDLNILNSADCCIIYDRQAKDSMLIFNTSSSYFDVGARSRLRSHITDLYEQNDVSAGNWYFENANGERYLTYTFQSDDYMLGIFYSPHTILMPYAEEVSEYVCVSEPDGTAILSANDAEYKSGFTDNDSRFLPVSGANETGNFIITHVFDKNISLSGMSGRTAVKTALTASTLFFILLLLWYYRKIIINPLMSLLYVMRRVREGKLNERIITHYNSNEFEWIGENFNGLLDEIKQLKIDVYEQKISLQQEELVNLRLQMNPHFFFNSLNMMSRLAQIGETDHIQILTDYLIGFFRYMMANHEDYVPLRAELEHTGNYIGIQQMRYPGRLNYSVKQEDPSLDEYPIPPFTIQNFVENTVKYAFIPEEPLTLTVELTYDVRSEGDLLIKVHDDGAGFDTDVLLSLRRGEPIISEGRHHIGISNVRKRLELLYGRGDYMSIYNTYPHGATVEIRVPRPKKERQGDSGNE